MVPNRKPKGNWRGLVPFLVFATLVFGLSIATTWDIASLETRKRVEAEQSASQYRDNTQERISRVCVDPATYIECVYEEAEASRENQRSEYDLYAQEGMLRWARWMTAISAVGTLVATIGVVFVWRAIRNDRDIGHAQSRAYISVLTTRKFDNLDDSILHEFRVDIRNSGTTPAKELSFRVRLFVREAPIMGWKFPKVIQDAEWTPQNIQIPAGSGNYTRVFIWVSSEEIERIAIGESAIFCCCQVVYIDIFGESRFVNSLEEFRFEAFEMSRVPGSYEAN